MSEVKRITAKEWRQALQVGNGSWIGGRPFLLCWDPQLGTVLERVEVTS